jgi:hypothetical protein
MEVARLSRRVLVACAVLLLMAGQTLGATQWYEHYGRGLELEARGQWAEALQAFRAAAAGQPRPRRRANTYGQNFVFNYDPHFHAARCLVELGRYRDAVPDLMIAGRAGVTPRPEIDALRQRIQEAGAGGGRRGGAPERSASSAETRIAVTSQPVGARVEIDGQQVGTTPLTPTTIEPGEHTVFVQADGFIAAQRTMTVEAGQVHTLDLTLLPLPASIATPAPPPAAIAQAEPPPTTAPSDLTSPPIPTATAPAVVPTQPEPSASPTAGAEPVPTFVPIEIPTRRPAGATLLLGGVAVALIGAVVAVTIVVLRRRRARMSESAPTSLVGATVRTSDPGTRMAGYALLAPLGRGGMATTYRATRSRDGSTVALKVPHEGCLVDPSFVARFVREGKLGEQLHHPRIVRIFEAGDHNGRPFLAMELLEGRTLKALLREKGTLPLARTLEITRDIAEALDYAHLKGVVHRDLKPENVMILADGTTKVMDFGIARQSAQPGLTSTNVFMGTPLYAAPEMVDPKNVDHRADLYALGIIVYEMVEGSVPFDSDSPYRVLEMHLRKPFPSRAELPRPMPNAVWHMITRLCAKDPAQRHPSAEALLVELNRMLQHLPELESDDVFA